MRVLILARGYPIGKHGTLGIFEYDQAKALARAGHDVVYMAMDHRSLRRWRRFGIHAAVQDGMTVISVHIPLGGLHYPLRLYLSERAMLHAYGRFFRDGKTPDVIHAPFAGMAILGARLKDKTGIPLVITEHSSKLNYPLPPFYGRELGAAYRKADVLTAVSNALSEKIQELFGIRSEVIPNIVDTDTFKVEKSMEKQSEFTFVCTGNLIPEKGMEALMEAFHKVHGMRGEARLVIFGNGPLYRTLVRTVQSLGLTPVVRFGGLVSRQALQEAYTKASCFVLASKSETFGVAYIEALASGLPVIATRSGGPEDYVVGSNGILVDLEDANALVDAMLWMMDHAHTYDSQAISEEVKKRFSSEAVVALLEEVFERAVQGKKEKN